MQLSSECFFWIFLRDWPSLSSTVFCCEEGKVDLLGAHWCFEKTDTHVLRPHHVFRWGGTLLYLFLLLLPATLPLIKLCVHHVTTCLEHLVPSPNLHISSFWHLLKKKSPQERVETILRMKCFGVSTRFDWDTAKKQNRKRGTGTGTIRPTFSSCLICVQLLCTSCPPLYSCWMFSNLALWICAHSSSVFFWSGWNCGLLGAAPTYCTLK